MILRPVLWLALASVSLWIELRLVLGVDASVGACVILGTTCVAPYAIGVLPSDEETRRTVTFFALIVGAVLAGLFVAMRR